MAWRSATMRVSAQPNWLVEGWRRTAAATGARRRCSPTPGGPTGGTAGIIAGVLGVDTTVGASVAAAQAVAREHGVACDEAVRIAAGSNVLVHLKPSPVVARVMTGTAVLHDDVEQWLVREVAVGAFLAERTDLVVSAERHPAAGAAPARRVVDDAVEVRPQDAF